MWIFFFLALFEGSALLANADVRILPRLNVSSWKEDLADLGNFADLRSVGVDSDCTFKINGDMKDPQPLFAYPNKFTIWQPNGEGVVTIPQGYALEMHCSQSFIAPFEGRRKIVATCIGGTSFSVDKDYSSIYTFSAFSCKTWANYVARRTDETCNGGTTLVKVGFELEDGFLEMMNVCHDEVEEATRYVHHKLHPGSANFQRSVGRPRFIEGDFYGGKNVDRIYTKVEQMKTIGEILGGNHEQYFNDKSDIYLARGHMSAKVDHVYGSHQRGTFFFINVAPQWQKFNAGNWERIEDGVRRWTSSQGMYVDCYTGVWGVTTLPDVNGVERELYLAFDENNNGLIPVPKLYFRVVIEPASKRGIVLLGVNNPHLSLEAILTEYVICDDISDKINWISWKKRDLLLGYSYACDVNEFAKVVPHLPAFDVQGLLY